MADPLASSSTPPASFSTTSYGRAKRVVASDVLGSHHPLLESSNSTFNPNSSSNAPYPVYTSRKPSLPVSPHASAPPLVTKAEDASSTAASSNGRSYSRSISEASPASEKLRGQNLRADIESLGLNSTGENESLGAAMVQKLSTVVGNVEFEGVLSAVGCDKVRKMYTGDSGVLMSYSGHAIITCGESWKYYTFERALPRSSGYLG